MAERLYLWNLLHNNDGWRITQSNQTQFDTSSENTAKSHNYCEAVDFASVLGAGAMVYAPVDMKVKYRQSSSNGIVLESVDEVQFASGVIDKFCMLLFHEDKKTLSETDFPINGAQIVKKGMPIYKEGTLLGIAGKVARHVHIHCGRGLFRDVRPGKSGNNELYTSENEVNITELFINSFPNVANSRRLKWLPDISVSSTFLVAAKHPIAVCSSIQGTSLCVVPKGQTLLIRKFERRDYTGYSLLSDDYEWARASFVAEGKMYAGFVKLDTRAYTMYGGFGANIQFTPSYKPIYLRTGLPYLQDGKIVRIETGKVLLDKSNAANIMVTDFIPELQADGYVYAKVIYNSHNYFVQVDTKKCYTLEN